MQRAQDSEAAPCYQAPSGRVHQVVSTVKNIARIWLSLYFMGCVRLYEPKFRAQAGKCFEISEFKLKLSSER